MFWTPWKEWGFLRDRTADTAVAHGRASGKKEAQAFCLCFFIFQWQTAVAKLTAKP
jgi:hypothetical protein